MWSGLTTRHTERCWNSVVGGREKRNASFSSARVFLPLTARLVTPRTHDTLRQHAYTLHTFDTGAYLTRCLSVTSSDGLAGSVTPHDQHTHRLRQLAAIADPTLQLQATQARQLQLGDQATGSDEALYSIVR